MTPTSTLVQLIDELQPQDREKVMEYIYLLHSKEYVIMPEPSDLDAQYRGYIVQGIREGEEDNTKGEVYESQEARRILQEMLRAK